MEIRPSFNIDAPVRGRALAALVLGAVSLFGCTPTTGTPDAGTPQLSCSSDAECSHGLVCDKLRRVCVCTSDKICAAIDPTVPYCNAFTGQCVADIAGCKSDAACGAGKFCDIALRTCRSKVAYCDPCTQDAECGGPNDNCVHYPDFPTAPPFCATACGAGDACPDGQKCAQTEKGKQCIPAAGLCNQTAACVPDSGQSCSSDTDCTQGTSQVCDSTLGRCVTSPAPCAQGEVCDATTHVCVGGCTTNQECIDRFANANYQCQNAACVLAHPCHQDTDCQLTEYCQKAAGAAATDAGVCAPTCNADTDCPLGDLCATNSTTGHRGCVPGCHDNSGCPLNAICDGGQCAMTATDGTPHCQAKEVCSFKDECIDNSCVLQPDQCKSCAAGCGAGGCATLLANYKCDNTTCPTGVPKVYLADSTCSTGRAYVCEIQRCLYRCTTDTECPNGFYCTSVDALGTGDQGPWCYPEVASYCL